ncbi:MAG: hypothetical protein M3Q48_10215 [Actinomycetota bacterium]|nr:hypothetical protein [Actinomycetota bacterium]
MTSGVCPDCGAGVRAGEAVCGGCGALAVTDDALIYEMDGWDPEERRALDRLLDAERVPYRWDGDDLLVLEEDEGRVDDLMDRVEYPDALEAADDEGDDAAVYAVMSDLFVAADRLAAERTVDVELAADVTVAAAAALATPAPFGVDPPAWDQVQQLAEGIVAAIEAEADDEVVVRDAATLRNVLRRYV